MVGGCQAWEQWVEERGFHTCKSNLQTNNSIKTLAKGLRRRFNKEDTPMANEHMRRCSTSFISREMQTQTTVRYDFTPIRLATIQKNRK